MEQRGPCSASGVIPGTDPGAVTPSQATLNLPAAWQFSRGEGQLVAVIDTGVRPSPRLPNVDPGGDFVETTDGLTDCDGHGTLVAGLIAGQPGRRTASRVSHPRRGWSRSGRSRPSSRRARRAAIRCWPGRTADVTALGRAIVHAADLGARVIDISTVICVPADRPIDQAALGAAIRYAAVDKDAVIVAAAGNTGSTGSVGGGTSCESNPLTDLSRPDDPRNWAGVTSVSVPSLWQPYVLSVAALTPDGQPSKFTMAGPWVGVAAPGENIVSVSNRDGGGLANGLPDEHQQLVALSGTSYAAGYVAGVAALVRSKYPGPERDRGGASHHRDRAQRLPGAVERRWRRQRGPGGSADLAPARRQRARGAVGETGRRSAGTGAEGHHTAHRRVRRNGRTGLDCRGGRRCRGDRPEKGNHLMSQLRSIPSQEPAESHWLRWLWCPR